jgi:hypothetical protein
LGLSQAESIIPAPDIKRQRSEDQDQQRPPKGGDAYRSNLLGAQAVGLQRQLTAVPKILCKSLGEPISLKNALLSSVDEDLELDDL